MSKPGIRLEIPDLPPEQQLEAVENFIGIIKTSEKITGEEGESDLTEAYEARDKLKQQIEGIDMELDQPTPTGSGNSKPPSDTKSNIRGGK